MNAKLEVVLGPAAGRTIEVPAGKLIRFGRTSKADCALPEDSFLSGMHFAVGSDEAGFYLRDLGSSNGTLLNGARVDQARLSDGDRIQAGNTTFIVYVATSKDAGAPAPASVPTQLEGEAISAEAGRLLQILRSQREPLFALLDAARNPKLIELLSASREEFRSLYEGNSAVDLALLAPYLVRLPPQSLLLQRLVREGWGKSWGIYLTCGLPLADLRHHLRHFLMVDIEGGNPVYFRFYDPRVLRVYLPTCADEERHQFFGPVGVFLMEGEECSEILQFKSKPANPEARGTGGCSQDGR